MNRKLAVLTGIVSLLCSLTLVADPAGAAVPTTSPTDTVGCANGKTARVWTHFQSNDQKLDLLAAENPCDRWLEIAWPGLSASDPYGDWIYVAPHSTFNWDLPRLLEWGVGEDSFEYNGISLVPAQAACVHNYETENGGTGFQGLLVYGWDSVRFAPECGQPVPRYNADRHARATCPTVTEPKNFAEFAWKLDGKKILKVWVYNPCPDWVVAHWQVANGRTVGVWVAPGGYTDLWLGELKPVPTATKDGTVTLALASAAERNRIGNGDPRARPYWYNATANGDTLVCTAGARNTCP
jgi:hypothetical protein